MQPRRHQKRDQLSGGVRFDAERLRVGRPLDRDVATACATDPQRHPSVVARLCPIRSAATGRYRADVSDLRALSETEVAVLDALLRQDFDGVEPLRVQASSLLARRGCECGCGTIELVPQAPDAPRSMAQGPVPVEATVLDGGGDAIGGVLLFVNDGLLSSLEVYSFADAPLQMPEPTRLVWDRIQRR